MSAWTTRAQQICTRRNDLLDQNSTTVRKTSDGSPQAVGKGVSKATDIIEAAALAYVRALSNCEQRVAVQAELAAAGEADPALQPVVVP